MWVTKEVYSTHTVTDIQTHRQTMAVEVNKLKNFALTSYPFGHLLLNICNEDEFLMSIGILFHIRTPEKDKLPLNKLHLAWGST